MLCQCCRVQEGLQADCHHVFIRACADVQMLFEWRMPSSCAVWINHLEHGAMLNNGKHSHKANASSHRHSLCATSSPDRSSVESKSAYNVIPCTCHGGNKYVIERSTHSITRGTLYIELHFTKWSSHYRNTYSSSAIWISCCAFSCFKRSQSSASSPW